MRRTSLARRKVFTPNAVPSEFVRSSTVQRVRVRLSKAGIVPHILGWWLGRPFQRAGILVVVGGLPLPSVTNYGRIEVENCAFFPGVRIECWQGGLIRIGNGTYLNRGTEIVAAAQRSEERRVGKECRSRWSPY